ncbi:MAG: hypothetical protein COY80_01955 [Candidatus Pacebacteria bacterium CG_4_10_14_0_8_um_filter_42_14]|nr:MAG: hypothetical protein COY80_01955 [Candidatus Pacebacteria bacterium CG_4_10_14_0_8_um_filter_42_14]
MKIIQKAVMVLGLALVLSYLLRVLLHDSISVDDLGKLGSVTGAVSTIYTLIIAFIIVEVWGQFNSLGASVAKEASTLVALWNFTDYLDDKKIDKKMRPALVKYIDKVLNEERTEASMCKRTKHPSDELIAILRVIDLVTVDNEKDAAVLPHLFEYFEQLSGARGGRLDASTNRLPMFLKFLFIFLSVMTGVLFFLIPFESLAVQIFASGIVSFIIYLSYTLIVDLDNPFSGSWNVDYSPLTEAREYIETSENL